MSWINDKGEMNDGKGYDAMDVYMKNLEPSSTRLEENYDLVSHIDGSTLNAKVKYVNGAIS